MKAFLIRIHEVLKEALLPTKCLACGSFFSVRSFKNSGGADGQVQEKNIFSQPPKRVFSFLLTPFLCSTCRVGFTPVESPICSRCGLMFKSRSGADHVCGRCLEAPNNFRMARSIGIYDQALMELIHCFKYKGKIQLARPLAMLLFSALIHYWGKEQIDRVIPVPLHFKKLRMRGFNQTFLMIRRWDRIAETFNLKTPYQQIAPDVLLKEKWTEPQTGLGRKKRSANIRDAFKLGPDADVDSQRILLVDDVYTTGATANECAKVLLRGGASRVDVITLARAL